LVFGVIAHANPAKLRELLRALDDYRVIVHLDKSVGRIDYFESLGVIPENVVFIDLDDSVSVNWGGISIVDAEIAIVSKFLEISREDSYLFFLSGECFPIRNLRNLEHELFSMSGDFVANISLIQNIFSENGLSLMSRYSNYWFRDLKLFSKVKNRKSLLYRLRNLLIKILEDVANFILPSREAKKPVMVGTQWICGSRKFFEFAHTQYPYYRDEFKFSLAPDEIMFHTIFYRNCNLFREAIVVSELNPVVDALFHIIHPSLSYEWRMSDLLHIQESGKYFARKMSPELRHYFYSLLEKEW
jgi:hypothetical protein